MTIKSLCNKIKNVATKSVRTAAASIPAIIMLCSLTKRPGLSSVMSLINIVQAFKDKGIPTEPNEDGTPNLNVQMAYIVVNEIFRALREDASIQGAGAPGVINVQGSGPVAGGLATVTGTNSFPFKIVATML